MSTEVLYRKWRPQLLSEVVGQEVVTRTLRCAVEEQKLAHAYLFSGPRGTGKTSTGRILIKAVNCLNPEDGEPCNRCEICCSINEGRFMDVIEIDAASNRGIDDIRSLREKVNYIPGCGRYKGYIIDEVHMLTDPASNALLKTLEEPPPHVIFVLATTEPHKVLPTIVSRCQHFHFRRLSQAVIVDKLAFICQQESVEADNFSLKWIARLSAGSLRDAENILQRLIISCGGRIDAAQTQEVLGLCDVSQVKEMVQHIGNRDISAGLRCLYNVSSKGVDLRQFELEIVDYLRELLLVNLGCEEAAEITPEDLPEMKDMAKGVPPGYLLEAIKLFSSTGIRADSYSTLPLEMALINCVLSSAGEEKEGSLVEMAPKAQAEATLADRSQEAAKRKNEIKPSLSEQPKKPLENEGVAAPAEEKDASEVDYLRGRWGEFVRSLRGDGAIRSMGALLRNACEPVELKEDILVLGFYHSFHKERLENSKHLGLLENKLEETFGRAYKVKCVLVDPKTGALVGDDQPNHLVQTALEMGARILD